MKRKLILAGGVVLIIFVAAILMAARNAPKPDRSNEYYRLTASSDGRLRLVSGERNKPTVILGESRVNNRNLPPPQPGK